MFKYNTNTLKKMEQLLKEAGYIVRYEKGSFQSGYCVLEDKRVAVINKFISLEARITALLDVLNRVNVNEKELEEKSLKFYKELKKEGAVS